jgi:hypothetical protein
MFQSVLAYSYLQLLDLLTTVAFLLHGVREGNPLVRIAMHHTGSPLTALLSIKVVALLLGLYCWRVDKRILLGRVNVLFAVLVAWNLLALILAPGRVV